MHQLGFALAFGVLLSAGGLLLMDRMGGTSFFIPGGLVVNESRPEVGMMRHSRRGTGP